MARRYKRDNIGRFAGGSGGTASQAKARAAKRPTGPNNTKKPAASAPPSKRVSTRTAAKQNPAAKAKKPLSAAAQRRRQARRNNLKAVALGTAIIGGRFGVAVYQGGKSDRQQAAIKKNITRTMRKVSGKRSRRTGAYRITNVR